MRSSSVFISEVKQVLLYHSLFSNLVGNSVSESAGGGAVYITETQSNKESSNSYEINSCMFINNSHFNGGAIYLNSMANVSIVNGTTFLGNTATAKGGAIDFYCPSNFDFDMS